jgi:hypothetical protein
VFLALQQNSIKTKIMLIPMLREGGVNGYSLDVLGIFAHEKIFYEDE